MKLTKSQTTNLKSIWTSRIAFNLNAAQAKAAGFGYMHLNPRYQMVDLGMARVLVTLNEIGGQRVEVLILTDLGREILGV